MPEWSSASIKLLASAALSLQAVLLVPMVPPALAHASEMRLDLRRYVGKYPRRTDILRLPEISRRFHVVLGHDYWKLNVGLETQAPMALEWTDAGKFLVLEGNEQHNSIALNLISVIDLTGDRIDVATWEDGNCKQYLDYRRSEDLGDALLARGVFDNSGYPVLFDVERWREFVDPESQCTEHDL